MRGRSPRTLIPILCVLCLPAFAQQATVVRIGVALLRTGTNAVSVTEARDRLVKALNQHKHDKKLRLSVNAVPLEAALDSKAMADAREKNCQFVLSTHLTDLQTSTALRNNGAAGMDYVPVYTAVLEYSLVRVADGTAFAIGSAKAENSTSRDAVLQAMGRLSREIVSDLGKRDKLLPGSSIAESPAAAPKRIEVAEYGSDLCAWLPTKIPHADAVRSVCEYAISLPEKMPNFICDEAASRYRGDNPVPGDRITASLRYEDGNESYSGIKVNGKPASAAIAQSTGVWSTGEFGSNNLRSIFDPRNQALFEFIGESTSGDHSAWILTYRIVKQSDPLWRLHERDQVVAPPYTGELWVDQKTSEVLRFRSIAKEIPTNFPMQAVEEQVGYESVAFEDGSSFVLPTDFAVSITYRGEEPTRNSVRLTNCHKFRAKARMIFNTPASTGRDTPPRPSADAAAVEKELAENNQIYAILREQAVREDAAAIEIEQRQELHVATVGALWKLAALEKEWQKNLARQEASAKIAPPPSAKEAVTTLRVSVKLVPVSVLLRDSKGQAVGNLRKEDFQLFDNGRPQVITSFSAEKAAMAHSTEKQARLPSGISTSQSNPPAAVERDVAYVFDDIHITSEDLASARDAAARHLAALRPDDRAAVFTTSGQAGLNFTADRQKLQDALQALRPHPLLAGVHCPPLSQYMADLIVNQDDLQTLSIATEDAISCAFGDVAKTASPGELARAEQVAKSTAFEVLNAGSAENQSALSVLREVVRSAAAAPGSRSIVLVSPGFLTPTPDMRQSIAELIDRAVRANIVVNTLDVRGLYTVGLAPNSSHPSDPVLRLRLDREEAMARSDVMADLAYGTGGTFFHNNNDLDEGFRRTADAPECVYVLGFSPQKLDGKFHKLKVRLNGPEKLTVQARQGYYALKSASGE